MGDGDARQLRQALANIGRDAVEVARTQAAIDQTEIHIRINLAVRVAGVDGGQGVTHFRQAAK